MYYLIVKFADKNILRKLSFKWPVIAIESSGGSEKN